MQSCRGYLVFILLTASTAYAGVWNYHWVPETLRLKIRLELRPYWDGILDINEIIIDTNGTAQIYGLSLADRGGRNWLTMKYAELGFAIDANGLKVSELKIKRPRVILWYDKGELSFPLHIPSPEEKQEKPSSFSGFEQITVEDAALTIASDETYATWKGFNLSARRIGQNPNYIVGVSCKTLETGLDANGFMDFKNNEADFDTRVRYSMASNQAAVLLSIFGLPVVHDATGQMAARLRFAGRIDKEEIWWPTGEIHLRDATLNSTKGPLMRNFKSHIVFPAQRLVLFQNMEADSFGGRFRGSAFVESPPERTDYGGHFEFRAVKLAQFSQDIGASNFFSAGKAEATYDFTGTAGDFKDYSGRGVFFFNDADIWKLPVISSLFRWLELGLDEPLTYSDAVAAFNVNGPVVTIRRANVGSKLTAIEFLPGSKINLENKYIDAHAVFVPLKGVRTIALKIPVVSLFVGVSDELAGVSIKGYLWEEPHQLIRKEPVTDIQKATVNFFRDAVKSGGQISSSAFTSMENLFGLGSSDAGENKTERKQ